jgi:NDP-sugar pyrophosphorylase family protein
MELIMDHKLDKAMILAAGLGTRLRPLTFETPKPLLPLNSKRIIDYPLQLLVKYEIKEVVINLHHLGHLIREYVGDGERYGLKVQYSEEVEILGTGGGIKNAETFFGGEPFLAINADALLNVDLKDVAKRYFETHAAAAMVIKKLAPDDVYGRVDIDPQGFIKTLDDKGPYFYTGVQVVGPELLEVLPPAGQNSCLIKDGYRRLLASQKKVATVIYDGYFNDVGTPERYAQAQEDLKELNWF